MNDDKKRLSQKWNEIYCEIEVGHKFKASNQLREILNTYPEELFIWNKLAELYYEAGFYDAAGKYWLIYPSNEYRVVKCIEIYRESMDESATRILNDLNFRGDKSKLRNFSKEILEELEAKSKNEGGFVYRTPIQRSTTVDVKLKWFKEAMWMLIKVILLLSLTAGILTVLNCIYNLVN